MDKEYTFPLLSQDECKYFIDYHTNYQDDYIRFDYSRPDETEMFRKQTLALIKNEAKELIVNKIFGHSDEIFKVMGFNPADPEILEDTFVSKYNVGDYVRMHQDDIRSKLFSYKNKRRWLNFSVKLNDTFDGGNLIINDANVEKQVGDVTIFKNPCWHEVTEVTKGSRYSLIGWIYDIG